MDKRRIDIFKEFAAYIEYPMIVFEAESGKVLDINDEAETLLGGKVKNIHIEPGRVLTKADFWNMLKNKKSLIWHRIRMVADGKEHLVAGLVNEACIDDILIYTLMFEFRADMNIGSHTLERIVNHGRIIALHVSMDINGKRHVEYASQNINQYGYSRAQLYEEGVNLEDLICPDDVEGLEEDMRSAVERCLDESSYECRFLTGEKELVPVRILLHYNYNDDGMLTDYEVIAFDRKEELARLDENIYLSNAISKMKSVLIVKSFKAGKRVLKYISANASILGMNVDALRQGNKLTEDYIHPDDRDAVIDSMYQAIANGVAELDNSFRVVRDDGVMVWVEGHLTIKRISDGEAEVSWLLNDITEQKELEKEIADMIIASEEKLAMSVEQQGLDVHMDHDIIEVGSRLQVMAESVGAHAGYFIVALAEDGKLITNPIGPAKNMGVFYDIVERPEIQARINEIREQAKLQNVSKTIDIDLGGIPVRMIFAPISVDEAVKAFWVLAAIDGEGVVEMSDVIEAQWRLASSIVTAFYDKDRVEEAVKNKKLTEFKLKREKQERKVLQELLNIALEQGETGLSEMCQRIGMYLSVSYIGIYMENKETENAVKYYVWNQSDDDHIFFDRMELSVSEIKEIEKIIGEKNGVSGTFKSKHPFITELAYSSNMKFVAIEMMLPGVDSRGYIAFGDVNREEKFDKNEQHFVTTAAKLIQEVVFKKQQVVKKDMIRQGFLETYDHIRDAVFVKNNDTGEIIFANKAMDKLFGYSLVGMQAQDIINDQMEQYRQLSGIKKRFIANNKVSKWQSYLKELDQIMNVVEIRLNVFTTIDLSLVILKKNKNK